METNRPMELAGIVMAGRELISASFDTKKRPNPQAKGFVNQIFTFPTPRFQRPTPTAGPSGFVLFVEMKFAAWSGELPPNGQQPTDEQQLMVCELKAAVHYRVTRTDLKEEDVAKCDWFFHPQLTMVAYDCLRNLLKDTPFAFISIGLPGD